ncbi:MAG: 7-cyano-7-deazaguanine synthase [archaeon]
MTNAIVLVSGGLDSVVLAHYLKKVEKVDKLKFVFFDYGQKSLEEELYCVKKVARELDAELKVVDVKWLGEVSTSLINKEVRDEDVKKVEDDDLVSWYVPCRNALFLLIGLSFAESELISKGEKYDVYIGIKHEGELQFKDTTPEFLEQMNKTSGFCTQEGNLKFKAPFLEKDKEEVIELAKELGVDLKQTCSCYVGRGFEDGVPVHCGVCAGCKSRKKAFRFCEVEDVSVYENV